MLQLAHSHGGKAGQQLLPSCIQVPWLVIYQRPALQQYIAHEWVVHRTMPCIVFNLQVT